MRCQKALTLTSLRCGKPQLKSLRPPSSCVSNAATRQGKEEKEAETESQTEDKINNGPASNAKEQGAMSRRLAEMTEDSLLEGGKSSRNNMQQAGFSEELKAKLEEKIAAASFKSEHAAAFSIHNMPVRSESRIFLDVGYRIGPVLTGVPLNRGARESRHEISPPRRHGRALKASTTPPSAC